MIFIGEVIILPINKNKSLLDGQHRFYPQSLKVAYVTTIKQIFFSYDSTNILKIREKKMRSFASSSIMWFQSLPWNKLIDKYGTNDVLLIKTHPISIPFICGGHGHHCRSTPCATGRFNVYLKRLSGWKKNSIVTSHTEMVCSATHRCQIKWCVYEITFTCIDYHRKCHIGTYLPSSVGRNTSTMIHIRWHFR